MAHRANASNNQSKEEVLDDIKHVVSDLTVVDDAKYNLTVARVDDDTAVFVVTVRDEGYERAK